MSESLYSICRIELAAPALGLRVLSVSAEERIGQPVRYRVAVQPEEPVEDWLEFTEAATAQEAIFSWSPERAERRQLHLLVDAVQLQGDALELELISRAGMLADGSDHRVFLDQTAIEICQELLGEHQIQLDVRCQRVLPQRAQCVQHFESVLGFASRILAEEGIVWFESITAKDQLVLVDAASGFGEGAARSFAIRSAEGLRADSELHGVQAVRVLEQLVTDRVSVQNFDFAQPTEELAAQAQSEKSDLERYEYPGGHTNESQGSAVARLRLEAHRSAHRVLHAETFRAGLAPGSIVELEGGGGDGAAGRWLLVAVSSRAEGNGEALHRAQLEAVPAELGYRLPCPRPATPPGVQTMTITGAPGDEIQTEEHGRIHAHFRWDRRRPLDDTSSAWLRVTQPANSGGFLLPRIGWEELMGFWRSADQPVTLGRLYNGAAAPPNALPEGRIVSAFGTMTSPGGGGSNLVQFSDAAGKESLHFAASFDLKERTEKDKATEITSDESLTVGNNRELIVGKVHSLQITEKQKYTVGTRTVGVDANKQIQANSDTVRVGGLRTFDIGGDHATESAVLMRAVGGAKTVLAIESESVLTKGASARNFGGSWLRKAVLGVSTSVGVANKASVNGAKSVKAKTHSVEAWILSEQYASRTESAQANITTHAKGKAKLEVSGSCQIKGAEVVFEAKDKLQIKADGVSITITSDKVVISGKYKGKATSDDSCDESYD